MRGCNKCVYHTSGECSQLECNFTTIEDVRNNAIDDFAERLIGELAQTNLLKDGYYLANIIKPLAKQLKAGESNGQ